MAFHNLGNIVEVKLSRFLFKTRYNLSDFVLFGSAKDLTYFGRLGRGKVIIKVSMQNVRTLSLFLCIIKIKNFQF